MVRAQLNLSLWPPGYTLSKVSPYRHNFSPLHPLPSNLFLFIFFYKDFFFFFLSSPKVTKGQD